MNSGGGWELHSRTSHVQHALDDRAHHGSFAQNDKLESIARYESDVFAWSLQHGHGELVARSQTVVMLQVEHVEDEKEEERMNLVS